MQLAQIERDDPEFPRPIILGAKRFYRREEIERWIAKKFGENAVTAPSEKPRKAAKRSSHVKRT
ncbi:MAG TPA: hypothetical protein VHU18_00505 [Rhizomicrobium sp.]|nr:hypothetical protein [Rhizomicrobium sp.]